MLKAAKCRPEKAMQNNTVTQRALARAGRAPRSPPALPPGVSMLTRATQAEKAQERCFVSKHNGAEQSVRCRKAGHATAVPVTGLRRALCSCKSETLPMFCVLPSGRSPPTHEHRQVQRRGSLLLAHVEVRSTLGREQLVTATT